jgi:Flp pilus assembly protein TadB
MILRAPPSLAAIVRAIFSRLDAAVDEQRMPSDDEQLKQFTFLGMFAMRTKYVFVVALLVCGDCLCFVFLVLCVGLFCLVNKPLLRNRKSMKMQWISFFH